MWSRRAPEARLPSVLRSFKLGGAGCLGGFHPEGFVPANFQKKPQNLRCGGQSYGIRQGSYNEVQHRQAQANVCSYNPNPQEITESVVSKRQASNGIDPDELDELGLSTMIEVVAGDMAIRELIYSGAATNLLHLVAYKRMPNPPLMTNFAGNLLLTNGKKTPVVGKTKLRVKVGSINELPVLVLDEKNPELIFRSRTMEEFRCSLDFDSNHFWTGKGEGSSVLVEMVFLQDPTRLEKCQTAIEADDGQRHDQTPLAERLSAPAHVTRGADTTHSKQ